MGRKPLIYLVKDAFPVGLDEKLKRKDYPQCTEQEIASYAWDEWVPGKPFKERPKAGQHDHGCDTMRYVAMEVLRPGYLKEEDVAGTVDVPSWTQEYCKKRLKRGQRRKPGMNHAKILQYE